MSLRGVGALVVLFACLAVPAPATTLHVYSSLPLQGIHAVEAESIVRGIRLALHDAGGRAGPFGIRYVSLDGSTRAAGSRAPDKVARNARRVARDDRAIFYVGEFSSAMTAVSLPILNRANLPQISPSNTYSGFTVATPGVERGNPHRWYPTGRRTYFRVIAQDLVQGAALASEMRDDGCRRLFVADDDDTYGRGIALNVVAAARRLGLTVVGRFRDADRHPGRTAGATERARADCFVFGGTDADGASRLYRAVAQRLTDVRLYGPDVLCASETASRLGDLADRFECSMLPAPIDTYPGGADFLAAYQGVFGRLPDSPFALYGYEAMKLGLDTLATLDQGGKLRERLRRALRAARDRSSVLGTYSIDGAGDTTLRTYGIYRGAPDGSIDYDHSVTAG